MTLIMGFQFRRARLASLYRRPRGVHFPTSPFGTALWSSFYCARSSHLGMVSYDASKVGGNTRSILLVEVHAEDPRPPIAPHSTAMKAPRPWIKDG